MNELTRDEKLRIAALEAASRLDYGDGGRLGQAAETEQAAKKFLGFLKGY